MAKASSIGGSILPKFLYAKQTFLDKQNAWYEVQPAGLEFFGVPAATQQHHAELEALVRRIVDAVGQGADVQALEAEVNERVYRLFGLSRDEIALIEEASEPRP